MKNQINFKAMIQERFDELKSVPARNPQAAARARARFLAQAMAAGEARRNKGWGFLFRKQQFAMNMFVALLVITSLFLGGATTVSAAQNELPGQPLYAVKTFSEDISLQFQRSPEAKVERLMELTQIRVHEMQQLIDAGQTPPEQVQLRLEQHIQQALQLCSNMDDATLDRTLPQLRNQLQQQDHAMQLLQSRAGQGAQSIVEQTRAMLQMQLHMVDDGMLNHEMFRADVRNGFHYGQTQTPPASGPSATSAAQQEQNGPATPQLGGPGNGSGNGLGPNPEPGKPNERVTPTPNNNGNGSNNGNNAGENDKNKDPKDKDPDKDGSNGKGSGSGGKNK
jgi:uncharacterized protein DUF5667